MPNVTDLKRWMVKGPDQTQGGHRDPERRLLGVETKDPCVLSRRLAGVWPVTVDARRTPCAAAHAERLFLGCTERPGELIGDS